MKGAKVTGSKKGWGVNWEGEKRGKMKGRWGWVKWKWENGGGDMEGWKWRDGWN